MSGVIIIMEYQSYYLMQRYWRHLKRLKLELLLADIRESQGRVNYFHRIPISNQEA